MVANKWKVMLGEKNPLPPPPAQRIFTKDN